MRAWLLLLAVLATFKPIVQVASTEDITSRFLQAISPLQKEQQQQLPRHWSDWDAEADDDSDNVYNSDKGATGNVDRDRETRNLNLNFNREQFATESERNTKTIKIDASLTASSPVIDITALSVTKTKTTNTKNTKSANERSTRNAAAHTTAIASIFSYKSSDSDSNNIINNKKQNNFIKISAKDNKASKSEKAYNTLEKSEVPEKKNKNQNKNQIQKYNEVNEKNARNTATNTTKTITTTTLNKGNKVGTLENASHKVQHLNKSSNKINHIEKTNQNTKNTSELKDIVNFVNSERKENLESDKNEIFNKMAIEEANTNELPEQQSKRHHKQQQQHRPHQRHHRNQHQHHHRHNHHQNPDTQIHPHPHAHHQHKKVYSADADTTIEPSAFSATEEHLATTKEVLTVTTESSVTNNRLAIETTNETTSAAAASTAHSETHLEAAERLAQDVAALASDSRRIQESSFKSTSESASEPLAATYTSADATPPKTAPLVRTVGDTVDVADSDSDSDSDELEDSRSSISSENDEPATYSNKEIIGDKLKPDPSTLVQIENSLLSLFNMKRPPKIDRSKIIIPEAMKQLYAQIMGHELVDSVVVPRRRSMLSRSANTVRSFTHIESKIDDRFPHHHRFRLYFDVKSIPTEEKLRAAELHLTRDAISDEVLDVQLTSHTRYQVIAYDITRVGIRGKRDPSLVLLDNKSVDLNSTETVNLDVQAAVNRWLATPKKNFGLLIEVRTSRSLKPAPHHHVRLRRSIDEPHDSWQHKQPVLYAYTDDGKHRTRSTRDTSTRSKRAGHHRRGHRRKNSDEICRRHSLYVDFADVGWSDWIVAPPGYDAFYCQGKCPFPLAEHMNSTNHAVVQTLVNNLNPGKVPKACCVPTQLEGISMLYLNDQNTVVLKNYQDMTVVGCGCR